MFFEKDEYYFYHIGNKVLIKMYDKIFTFETREGFYERIKDLKKINEIINSLENNYSVLSEVGLGKFLKDSTFLKKRINDEDW